MSQQIYRDEILPMRDTLFFLALRMLNEEQDAEDAVQEVLLKLWTMRHLLGNYDNRAAFATTVTKNHCLDRIKCMKRTLSIDDSFNSIASTENPYLHVERKNSDEIIKLIIDCLPGLQRSIIRMKDVEGYEVDEIAEITGTTPEAVRVNLSRARKKVRDEFLKQNRV